MKMAMEKYHGHFFAGRPPVKVRCIQYALENYKASTAIVSD